MDLITLHDLDTVLIIENNSTHMIRSASNISVLEGIVLATDSHSNMYVTYLGQGLLVKMNATGSAIWSTSFPSSTVLGKYLYLYYYIEDSIGDVAIESPIESQVSSDNS
jgi:hypothetical protein